MEFFRIHKTIPFMRPALVLNIISLITFLLAVFFIATRGFQLSIEFTGGTVMEMHYEQAAPVDDIRSAVDALGYKDFQVQNFGTSKDVMIRLPVRAGQDTAAQSQTVLKELQKAHPQVKLQRV
ncbi:MAG TPA: protein translocase subunit SecF, partial [Castellaniella sp.]|nr:protein translocase subunit SecF [Castellaniella sp.]